MVMPSPPSGLVARPGSSGDDPDRTPTRPTRRHMAKIPLILLLLAALLPIAFGFRYLRTTQFMPYHAVAASTNWDELGLGVQTIILGMLRIVGGGLISYGLALLWLLLPLGRGESWAMWAILTISLASIGPTFYVTI